MHVIVGGILHLSCSLIGMTKSAKPEIMRRAARPIARIEIESMRGIQKLEISAPGIRQRRGVLSGGGKAAGRPAKYVEGRAERRRPASRARPYVPCMAVNLLRHAVAMASTCAESINV